MICSWFSSFQCSPNDLDKAIKIMFLKFSVKNKRINDILDESSQKEFGYFRIWTKSQYPDEMQQV